MRIRTLLQSVVSFAILMVLTLTVANWFISAKLANISLTEELSLSAARDVTVLLVLTHEYALFSEERAAQQWWAKQAEIVRILEARTGDDVPAPPEALSEARLLPELFKQLISATSGKTDLQNRQRILLLNQLLTNTQILADSVNRWGHASIDHRHKIEHKLKHFAITIPILILLILTIFTTLIIRRVLRPLSSLHQAVLAVAKGDLTVRSATMTNDEFGDLSRIFDAMAVDLVTELQLEITERKQIEEALRESDQRFENAFKYSAIGMAIVSMEGKWLKVNSKVCSFLGYSEDELMSKTFQDISHPDDLDSDLNYLRQLLAGEIETYTMEKRYYHSKGNIIWVLLAVALVCDSVGAPLYFVSQIEDITKRKLAEKELLDKNSELERFAYTVSHDLKSPLITIQSYAGMIKQDMEAGNHARAKDDLKRIECAASKMTELLNDLLELSRFGRQMNAPSRIDMNRLIKDTLAQLAGSLVQQKIEVVLVRIFPL